MPKQQRRQNPGGPMQTSARGELWGSPVYRGPDSRLGSSVVPDTAWAPWIPAAAVVALGTGVGSSCCGCAWAPYTFLAEVPWGSLVWAPSKSGPSIHALLTTSRCTSTLSKIPHHSSSSCNVGSPSYQAALLLQIPRSQWRISTPTPTLLCP